MKFCVERIVDGKPYPNLAQIENATPSSASWKLFSRTFPYSEPVHFFEYLDCFSIPYKLVSLENSTRETLYPISISFFDFDMDWFSVMSPTLIEKLRNRNITVWFFYSEGDDPVRIDARLAELCKQYNIDRDLILFTSANSSASTLKYFTHFVDDECLFQLRNTDTALEFNKNFRDKKFTALVRTHKWWRATTLAQLWRLGYQGQGYFGYNTEMDHIGDTEQDNPIEVDLFDNLRHNTREFIKNGPFHADQLNSDQHNLYSTTVSEHFENSYLNVVLETHLRPDGGAGVFLTEKTFKPIKNCQMFIMFGTRHSIQTLRDMGYRTFDHVIDHSYDAIIDTTARWFAAIQEFRRLMSIDLHEVHLSCQSDLEHNQKLFLSSKTDRLNNLLEKLKYATNN